MGDHEQQLSRSLGRRFVVVLVLLSVFAAWFVIGARYMSAAAALIRSTPSESVLELQWGANANCPGVTLASVAFWQQGPHLPERQGYVCGGLVSAPTIVVVPFGAGPLGG